MMSKGRQNTHGVGQIVSNTTGLMHRCEHSTTREQRTFTKNKAPHQTLSFTSHLVHEMQLWGTGMHERYKGGGYLRPQFKGLQLELAQSVQQRLPGTPSCSRRTELHCFATW